jgi:hypothetical protein
MVCLSGGSVGTSDAIESEVARATGDFNETRCDKPDPVSLGPVIERVIRLAGCPVLAV